MRRSVYRGITSIEAVVLLSLVAVLALVAYRAIHSPPAVVAQVVATAVADDAGERQRRRVADAFNDGFYGGLGLLPDKDADGLPLSVTFVAPLADVDDEGTTRPLETHRTNKDAVGREAHRTVILMTPNDAVNAKIKALRKDSRAPYVRALRISPAASMSEVYLVLDAAPAAKYEPGEGGKVKITELAPPWEGKP